MHVCDRNAHEGMSEEKLTNELMSKLASKSVSERVSESVSQGVSQSESVMNLNYLDDKYSLCLSKERRVPMFSRPAQNLP